MSFHRASATSRLVTVITLALLASLVVGTAWTAAAGDFKLKAEREENGNVRLIWTAIEDPDHHHYNIYWEEEEFDSVSGLEARAGERGTTYVPQDLENEVYYYFAVTSVDANGTILAQDFAEKAQLEPHLKVVNYWNLMALFWAVAIVFIFVIWKIPAWADEREGGA